MGACTRRFPRAAHPGRSDALGVEQCRYVVGDRERGGESGRFDAVEIDELRHAVLARSLDYEIRRRRAGSGDFRPDAGIAGLQGAVFEPRVVAAYRLVEGGFPALVEAVIDAIDPVEVRPELRLPAEIERHMNPEPVLARDWIDETAEGRPAGERVIGADGVIGGRYAFARNAGDRVANGLRVKACAVDDIAAEDLGRFRAADVEREAFGRGRPGYRRTSQCESCALRLRIAEI